MTTLAEHQFEILPTEDAADGFVFGIGAEVNVREFDPGEFDRLTQDSQNTRRGVTGFGRDVPGAMTWVWESHADKEDVAEALDVLDRFSGAWIWDEGARNPGELTAIRYRVGDRYRRVFGRPRRYAAPPSNLILNGFVPITHDFQCVDMFTYDDEVSQVNIPYLSDATGGGFTFPTTFPISTLPSEGTGSGQVSVTGSVRAYPVIRFQGPWTNPLLQTDDWSLRWQGSIANGDWVEIDTRPWKLTVMNSDGGSALEGLDRRTWLEDLWFAPNSRPQISLGGTSASGSAAAIVSWRNTWTSF